MARTAGAPVLVRALKSLFQACADLGVRIIDTRHESAAAHMADTWARTTGRPGPAW